MKPKNPRPRAAPRAEPTHAQTTSHVTDSPKMKTSGVKFSIFSIPDTNPSGYYLSSSLYFFLSASSRATNLNARLSRSLLMADSSKRRASGAVW